MRKVPACFCLPEVACATHPAPYPGTHGRSVGGFGPFEPVLTTQTGFACLPAAFRRQPSRQHARQRLPWERRQLASCEDNAKATIFPSWAANTWSVGLSRASTSSRSVLSVRQRPWSAAAKMSVPCLSALVLVRFNCPLGARCGLVEIAFSPAVVSMFPKGGGPRLVTITSVIGSDFWGWLRSASGTVALFAERSALAGAQPIRVVSFARSDWAVLQGAGSLVGQRNSGYVHQSWSACSSKTDLQRDSLTAAVATPRRVLPQGSRAELEPVL
jgi:hypothetical protein